MQKKIEKGLKELKTQTQSIASKNNSQFQISQLIQKENELIFKDKYQRIQQKWKDHNLPLLFKKIDQYLDQMNRIESNLQVLEKRVEDNSSKKS